MFHFLMNFIKTFHFEVTFDSPEVSKAAESPGCSLATTCPRTWYRPRGGPKTRKLTQVQELSPGHSPLSRVLQARFFLGVIL